MAKDTASSGEMAAVSQSPPPVRGEGARAHSSTHIETNEPTDARALRVALRTRHRVDQLDDFRQRIGAPHYAATSTTPEQKSTGIFAEVAELDERVTTLAETVGAPSNLVEGKPARGIHAPLEKLLLLTSAQALATEAATVRAAKRSEWWTWMLRTVLGLVIVASVGAIIAYVSGFHR